MAGILSEASMSDQECVDLRELFPFRLIIARAGEELVIVLYSSGFAIYQINIDIISVIKIKLYNSKRYFYVFRGTRLCVSRLAWPSEKGNCFESKSLFY